MKQKILILFAVVYLSSCSNREDKKADVIVTDTTQTTVEKVDTVLEQQTFSFFTKPSVKSASGSYKMVNTWKEDSLLESKFEASPDFYKKYEPYIRYSPDKTRFLDLGSYNVEATPAKGGKYKYEDIGPDTEVSLVDPSRGTRERIMFLGPGATVDDAGWMDNETIVLAGQQENASGDTTKQVIWKFHLPTMTFYEYNKEN